MEQSNWGPRGNPGESGTHAGRRMCEIELKDLEWFEITILESKAFFTLFENVFFKKTEPFGEGPKQCKAHGLNGSINARALVNVQVHSGS